jgi:TRAP-type C4-dicarboxylate transport system permease small subunit
VKLANRKGQVTTRIALVILIGLIFLLAGVGLYLQASNVNSQLPTLSLPMNPDALTGIIAMVIGVGFVILGLVSQRGTVQKPT